VRINKQTNTVLKKESDEGLEYEALLNEEQRLWNVITITRR